MNKLKSSRTLTAVMSDTEGGPSESSVKSVKQKPVRQTSRFHRSHVSGIFYTRSYKQIIKAVKIWKMPYLTGVLKPTSFKEQLRRVEMHRKTSQVSTAPKSIFCTIRDLQLGCPESSPSPDNSPIDSHDTRRRRPVHTKHYRRQLKWYHTLTRNKRPQHKLDLQAQRSLTSSSMTGTDSEYQTDRKRRQRSSPSAQSPPEFQTPVRKSSRRLWRRQLDSSGSDSGTPINELTRQISGNAEKPCTNKRVSFANLKAKTLWTEFNFLDYISDSSKATSPEHKTQKSLSAISQKDKRKKSLQSVQSTDVTGEKRTLKSSRKTQNCINDTMKRDKQQKVTNSKKTKDHDSTTSNSVPSLHIALPLHKESENCKTTQKKKKKKKQTTTTAAIRQLKISDTGKTQEHVDKTKLRASQKPDATRAKISTLPVKQTDDVEQKVVMNSWINAGGDSQGPSFSVSADQNSVPQV